MANLFLISKIESYGFFHYFLALYEKEIVALLHHQHHRSRMIQRKELFPLKCYKTVLEIETEDLKNLGSNLGYVSFESSFSPKQLPTYLFNFYDNIFECMNIDYI